jgi:hypothetical protein
MPTADGLVFNWFQVQRPNDARMRQKSFNVVFTVASGLSSKV